MIKINNFTVNDRSPEIGILGLLNIDLEYFYEHALLNEI